MMKHKLLLLTFSIFAFACDAPKKAQPAVKTTSAVKPKPAVPSAPLNVSLESKHVAWLDSERLMPVLEKAQQGKLPVFVEFYASWCAPCKVMEQDVFTQPEVSRYLNTHFLNFHTDFDSAAGKTIAEIYEVTKLPTILFLNPQGVVLERYTGVANAGTLNSLGNSALNKMKN